MTVDTDSPPGSWRAALRPEGPPCAVCRQAECAHSDLEYAGLVPSTDTVERRRDIAPASAPSLSFHGAGYGL
jgi:hypothetical protein